VPLGTWRKSRAGDALGTALALLVPRHSRRLEAAQHTEPVSSRVTVASAELGSSAQRTRDLAHGTRFGALWPHGRMQWVV